MRPTLNPCSIKEGFIKQSDRCKQNYYENVHKFKSDIDWSWLYYAIPIVLSIVLFFILPKEEEYISLVLMGLTLLIGIIIGVYKLIKNLIIKPCPECDLTTDTGDSSYITLVETAKNTAFPQSEIEKAEKIEALFKCPGQKPFDPEKEPPDSTLIAGYNYDECIKRGFSVDFCTTTPIKVMGPGNCGCDNGDIGYRDPQNIAACLCP